MLTTKAKKFWPIADWPTILALGGVAGVYLWLAFGVLPAGGYWSVDNGYKRIQADNIRFTPWLDLSIDYPGRRLDPSLRYVPFGLLFHYVWRGEIHLTQSPAIAIVGKPFAEWLGGRGELVVPMLSGLVSLWLTSKVMRKLDAHPAWIGVLLTGLATPLIFYSLNFWEHTLGVALGLGAVALALEEAEQPPVWRNYWLSGALAALAGGVRKELLMLALMLGSVLAFDVLKRRRGVRYLALWAGGCAAVLVILEAFSYINSGNIIPPELRVSVTPQYTPRAYILVHGAGSIAHFLFGPTSGWIGYWLTIALGAYGLAQWIASAPLRGAIQGIALAALGLGTWSLAQQYARDGNVYGVLNVSPFLALGFAPGAMNASAARRLFIIVFGFWGLAVLGLGLLTATGPWHSAQEWGARFMLVVFPVATVWAVSGLRRIWEQASESWLARLQFLAGLGMIGVSVYVQSLGVGEIYARVAEQREAQAAALALPETQVITNLDWLAPHMPKLYAAKEIFLVQSHQGLAACLTANYAQGARTAVFISTGMLAETLLPELAPPGARLVIVETQQLGVKLYATRLAIRPP